MSRDPEPLSDFDRLLIAWVEGVITPDEMRLFEQALLDNPEARRRYCQYTSVHATLQWVHGAVGRETVESVEERLMLEDLYAHAAERRRAHEAEGRADRLMREGPQARRDRARLDQQRQDRPLAERRPKIIIIPKSAVWGGLAAVIGLVVWLSIPLLQPQTPITTTPEPGATDSAPTAAQPVYVAQVLDSYNSVSASPLAGNRLETGVAVELTAGFIELRFDDGAALLVQGPAVFEPTGPNGVRLIEGRLTAEVPERARGFEVVTPYLRLIDLGTSFGIEVDSDDASTDTHVFKGLVRVRGGEVDEATAVALDLNAGEGAVGGRGATVERTRVNPGRFTRALEMAPYAVEASETVRFLQEPPASLMPGAVESDDWLHLVLERTAVHVPEVVSASFTEPGKYGGFGDGGVGAVRLGRPVDSYLMHFDPVGVPELAAIEGEITFPRPVVAVIGEAGQIARSDRWFARPGVRLYRGSGPIGLEAQFDTLELSEDRRTLRFHLQAITPFDELRVLIESEEGAR